MIKGKLKKTARRRGRATRMEILRTIYGQNGKWISTNAVANKIETNWNTALKYLKQLFNEGYLMKGKSDGGTTYWKEHK